MSDHDKVKSIALIADQIEHGAGAMLRRSRAAGAAGDACGATRGRCISAREYDWAAKLWDAIGFQERAIRCRNQADAVRSGDSETAAATLTAETITDEQIRELWSTPHNGITGRILFIALGHQFPWGEFPSAEETRAARARCAEILNARTPEGAK